MHFHKNQKKYFSSKSKSKLFRKWRKIPLFSHK